MNGKWAWVIAFACLIQGCGSSAAQDSDGPQTPPVIVEGDYLIASDAELQPLAGATEVRGSIEIDGAGVTTLSALSSLALVTGDLRITNTSLVDLQGLRSLTRAGAFLWIERNQSLLSLDGLQSLTSTGSNLVVSANWELLTLEGLNALTTVEGLLAIRDNVALSTISALSNLKTLGYELSIYNNFGISECEVEVLRQRLLENGWVERGTINGLQACTGVCNGNVCE